MYDTCLHMHGCCFTNRLTFNKYSVYVFVPQGRQKYALCNAMYPASRLDVRPRIPKNASWAGTRRGFSDSGSRIFSNYMNGLTPRSDTKICDIHKGSAPGAPATTTTQSSSIISIKQFNNVDFSAPPPVTQIILSSVTKLIFPLNLE